MRGRKVDTEYAAQSMWHGQDIVGREQTEARSESKLKGMSRQSVAKKKREKSSKQTDVPRGYRSAIGAQATDMTQVYPVESLRSSVETEMGYGVQGEAEDYVSFFSLSSISTQAEISCSLILCLIAPLAISANQPKPGCPVVRANSLCPWTELARLFALQFATDAASYRVTWSRYLMEIGADNREFIESIVATGSEYFVSSKNIPYS